MITIPSLSQKLTPSLSRMNTAPIRHAVYRDMGWSLISALTDCGTGGATLFALDVNYEKSGNFVCPKIRTATLFISITIKTSGKNSLFSEPDERASSPADGA